MAKPTPEEIEQAQNEIAHAYLQALLEILAFTDQDEVNFVKKSIQTSDGGTYLLQFQHVCGPKISLKKLMQGTE